MSPTTNDRPDHPRRRYVILSEGRFGQLPSKTAIGVIRYANDAVVAVIDSTQAGRNVRDWLGPPYDIPIVATLEEALPHRPTALLIGIAPQGGKIPPDWRRTIRGAIDDGLDIVSGLHEFVGDDPEFAAAARARGVEIVDHRRPPDRLEVAALRPHEPGKRVILTVGTDCAIGKMSVSLELRRAARDAGLLDRVRRDRPDRHHDRGLGSVGRPRDRRLRRRAPSSGSWNRARRMGDWVFVEGQGSLDHPAYSSVTLGLIHGATPHGMVMVHEPGRAQHHGWEDVPGDHMQPLVPFIRLHEAVAGMVAPSKVVAIALHTGQMSESAARAEIARVAEETGLPTDDPVRFGGERLMDGIRAQLADVE